MAGSINLELGCKEESITGPKYRGHGLAIQSVLNMIKYPLILLIQPSFVLYCVNGPLKHLNPTLATDFDGKVSFRVTFS